MLHNNSYINSVSYFKDRKYKIKINNKMDLKAALDNKIIR
jgi:hypothetical protein